MAGADVLCTQKCVPPNLLLGTVFGLGGFMAGPLSAFIYVPNLQHGQITSAGPRVHAETLIHW
jgi:hypothetical protein